MRCVALNNRFYVIENLSPLTKTPIKIVDPLMQKIIPIAMCPNTAADGPVNEPTCTRLNYALAECGNKIFMYGGVNEKNEVLSTTDMFDCCTYKFSPVKYRGDYMPPGR